MNDKLLHYIWLSCTFSPGSKTPKLLFEHFGTIEEIFAANKEQYEAISLSKSDVTALCNKNLDNAKRYYEYCEKNKIGLLCFEDSYYPERLKIINNPPPLFYYKGRLNLLDDYPCIAMVGTRSCSERGFRLAYCIGYDAASKGTVVVNGLALGIDGACIAGALDANGYAVGILGCGIDRVYPEGNRDLFNRLSATGLILTEFSPFTRPEGRNFPVRNRVISGLSIASAIFEADESSGAMITAKHALEQGRRIFAVPGKPYDKTYSGPLELIKDGATVFTESDDILAEYSMSFPHRINLANINEVPKDKLDAYVARYFKKDVDPDAPVNRRFTKKIDNSPSAPAESKSVFIPKENNSQITVAETVEVTADTPAASSHAKAPDLSILTELERKIYDHIKSKSMTPDEIAEKGIKIEDVLSTLTLLEIYGLITAVPGGKYSAV